MKENTENEIVYKIFVTTSDLPHAGLSGANVFLQIFGVKRVSSKRDKALWVAKFPLERSKTFKKKFQAGHTDEFEVYATDVGKIKKIRIEHDGKSSWHLKKILIEVPSLEKSWKFKFNKFLGPLENKSEAVLYPVQLDEDDSEFEIDLDAPNTSTSSKPSGSIRYDIKIKTANYSDDAQTLKLKIVGNKGETNKINLNNTPSDNQKDKLLRDSLDLFKTEEIDVGIVSFISFLIICWSIQCRNLFRSKK